MKLIQIFEEKISALAVSDAESAAAFISRIDKEERATAHPAVDKKMKQLDTTIDALGAKDPRIEDFKAAKEVLMKWKESNPIQVRMNPPYIWTGGQKH